MTLSVIGNLAIAAILLLFLYRLQQKHVSFTRRVFAGLGLGILFGAALQLLYGAGAGVIGQTIDYLDIVGSGYVKLLQMIITPLIMVSIIGAILKLNGGTALGKISAMTIGVLIFTTMLAAGAGILMSNLFGLTAEGLTAGAAETARGAALQTTLGSVESMSFAKMVLEFIPANPFLDMTGSRKTSTIAVVIFSIFIGLSATGIARKKPEIFESFGRFMEVAHVIVMRMVTLVLRLTPYGVLALMAKVVSGSNYADILNLLNFVMASYGAIAIMFAVHLLLVGLVGINPLRFLKKIMPVLAFAFTSRTSAGSIPMNVQTQTKALGIPEGIANFAANFAASFGSTIGQNGCAGIYPAMLAVMIAPTVGVNPMDPGFIMTLIAIITVSSFGVAGIGGGATFAALIVLSALDFPVALAGLLISIEPLIDMGRTALNVSGSITAGTVTSRLLGETDMQVFNSEHEVCLDGEESTI
ncbi:L-cystine transporter [Aeromonas salmonicida]|uniref:L-cystine transporter n=2 Tax=Aeromonas salmonicida TaxID=645 RepID=UPI0024788683|nr:L-cystine transporter [Aeromonas salmonicida]ELI6439561.1 L-cystine transporter [Aeromonas salmonicida subsp. salmonicida]ELM3708983.1 L-cystine transporter [Aeromonas salmonicida subsp. salmonicida]ELT1965122.1 L-cystine transporter [Aeromonas salmonicida]MDH7626347.1 L-cystine transporter [Aeromonas salmonicida]